MAIKNAKTFAQVQTELQNLPLGEHKLIDIVKIIKQCETFKDNTLDSFKPAIIDESESTVNLDEVYVDLTYQRKLKLKKLLQHLQRSGGFNLEEAGHIDIAVRSNKKKFVWDGFRRSIMALLCGMIRIEHSCYTHTAPTIELQRIKEAELFTVRNAKSERMGADEIFFARYAAGEEYAKDMKHVLDRANINICGLKPGGRNMGGFAFVEKELGYQEREYGSLVDKNILDDDFVWASEQLQDNFEEGQLSSYLVCALANTRQVLKNDAESDIKDELFSENFKEWASKEGNKQKTLIEKPIKNRVIETITFRILREIVKLNGRAQTLSGLSKEDLELLEDLED